LSFTKAETSSSSSRVIRINVADLIAAKKNLNELFRYKNGLKFDFSFSRMLSNINQFYYKYAKVYLFRELSNLSFEERMRIKKEMEQRGEKYDNNKMMNDEENPAFKLKRPKKVTREFVRRKSADYLRKYDYRKLLNEKKKAMKK